MGEKNLLKIQGYAPWLCGDTSAQLLGSVKNFVFPLVCLTLTGSPVQAGLVATSGIISEGIFDFIGGLHADKRNRVGILLFSSIFGLFISGFLLFWEIIFHNVLFVILLLVNILISARLGYSSSASTSALVDIVPDKKLGAALSANQVRDSSISLAGGPLGGILLACGLNIVYLFMFLLESLATVFNMVLFRKHGKEYINNSGVSEEESGWKNIFAGFRWILSSKGISFTLISSTLVSFSVSSFITVNIYSMQIGEKSYQEIGFFSTSVGAGMLLGSLVSNLILNRFNFRAISVSVFLLIGAQLFLSALVDSYYVNIINSFLIFLLIPSLNVGLMTYLILLVPGNLMGRVNSAASLINLSSSSLSPLFAGLVLYFFSRSLVLICCFILVVLALGFALMNKQLMGMPRQENWSSYLKGQAC